MPKCTSRQPRGLGQSRTEVRVGIWKAVRCGWGDASGAAVRARHEVQVRGPRREIDLTTRAMRAWMMEESDGYAGRRRVAGFRLRNVLDRPFRTATDHLPRLG